MIEVNSISKEFKINQKSGGIGGAVKSFFHPQYKIVKAVDNLSFHIGQGEIVGFIGMNGAGKSTTIKMLSGLIVPSSGECRVNGIVPYENRKEHTKNIGVVFGNRSQLWWDLPVCDSFKVLKKIYDVPENVFKERLAYLVDTLDISEFYDTPVRNLSLGQKMRADFVASLLHNPPILFLDEPTIGLDIIVKDKIRKAIKEINKEFKTTILLTTHDIADIESVCNKIVVIDKGRKIYEGTIDDLKKYYGRMRSILIDSNEDSAETHLSETIADGKCIFVKKQKDGKIKIDFDNEVVSLPELIQNVVKECHILDFTLQEIHLEEIIKQIYVH